MNPLMQQPQEKEPWYVPTPMTIQKVSESCVLKGTMSGVGGFVIGGAFGLFMSSFDTQSTAAVADLPFKQQIRHVGRDMGKKCFGMAKQFGTVGAIYGTSECVIEGYRAKHDVVNAVAAGCVTGGALSLKAGPHAAFMGCAGFAAFSAAIEYYMES